MSHHSYIESQKLSAEDPNFDALIMSAIRKADTNNTARLKAAFPEIYHEFEQRYHAGGGLLEGETPVDHDDSDSEEPPDAETIVRECYYCGRTFDTGEPGTGIIGNKPDCGACDGPEESD